MSNTTQKIQRKTDCLSIKEWDPESIMYSQPKKSKLGKDIYLSSLQLNSKISIQTPPMKCWGISDYEDKDTGISSGRFTMSLSFPSENYSNEDTEMFKTKIQKMQAKILKDAYENRVSWFGDDELTQDVIKSKMYSILKYPKVKDEKGAPTKKSDMTKPPSLSLKVPNYNNVWNIEVYDMDKNRLFPTEIKDQMPSDFVPKGSTVITKIQCGGIWTGDKAWGVKWNLVLCFVKPNEQLNLFDISSIELPKIESADEEKLTLGTPVPPTTTFEKAVVKAEPVVIDTNVEDSDPDDDDEDEVVVKPAPVVEEEAPKVIKKKMVVKKKV
jgi:hypothetical protein